MTAAREQLWTEHVEQTLIAAADKIERAIEAEDRRGRKFAIYEALSQVYHLFVRDAARRERGE